MRLSKKGTFESYIIFLLSPFLSIPFIFLQIIRKDKNALFLLSLLMGIISYLYVPHISNDKTRYIERYLEFKHLNFQGFIEHLIFTQRPDFIFESFMFLFSFFNFNINLLFFATTTFTFFTIFFVANRLVSVNEHHKYFLLMFFLFFLSFSFPHLFSGIRFYLGTAFFLWSMYYMIHRKKLLMAVFMFIAIQTHFSFIAFVVPLLVLYLLPYKNYKIFFICSLGFLILPYSVIEQILSSGILPQTISFKTELYLYQETEISENLRLLDFLRNFWVYLAFVYLLLRENDKSLYYNINLLFFAIVNVTHILPVVFMRYSIVLKILFILLLLFDFEKNRRKRTLVFFCIFFILAQLIDIYLLRYNFLESFDKEHFFNLYSIFIKNITLNDILY